MPAGSEAVCVPGEDIANTDDEPTVITVARDPNAKHADRETASPGEIINFTIEFENEGEGIAYGVYVTDTLEEDIDASTLVLPPGEGGVYDPDTRTISWFIGEVGPGGTGERHFSANVRSDAACGAEVTNYATVYFPSVPEVTPTNGVAVRVVDPACDGDGDGIFDTLDLCPAVFNPADADGDTFDGEDPLDGIDNDGDGLIDEDYETGQEDFDDDGKGDPCDQDDDQDAMIDAFEVAYYCLNPFADDAALDPDGDGSSNHAEFLAATDPCPPQADAAVSVTLQGRPAAPDVHWVLPLHVILTPQGSATPIFDGQVTTDTQGRFALYGLLPGTYRLWVKSSRTLAVAGEVTLVAGDNVVNIGLLREGDANDNNIVNIVDFSVLALAYGKSSGQPTYDERADFNQDGFVGIGDFSLLALNFGLAGAPQN
ncbi:MAG: DUF11 domain-containing protein [Chloroflexi bacterium]|nr:DUF11 domain-containing protein [Chloroflexota bacterium]